MSTHTASYTSLYLEEVKDIAGRISRESVEEMVQRLRALREGGGRVFFLGVGGGAANASHAVNDFRKIAGIEAYAPTDNVSELTARINDDGWESAYANWLKGSRLGPKDGVFVFSVGGGDADRRISTNLISAVQHAKAVGASVLGIVGRAGGYTAEVADCVVLIPTVSSETITPHTESFQAVIWHLIVSHPLLQANPMKWESIRQAAPPGSDAQNQRPQGR